MINLSRDEFRSLAIGQHMITNHGANFDDCLRFANGAIWALDLLQKKQREADYKKATKEPTPLKPIAGGRDE